MMKRLDERGFTLIEVLTVIVVITAVMMITLPLINSLSNKNTKELYNSYEKMMEEYAIASNIKNKDKIMLSELDGLDKVKSECEGYVLVNNESSKEYKAYIKCGDKYITDNYNNSGSSTQIIDPCPGCKFIYVSGKQMYATWNSYKYIPTQLSTADGLKDNYQDVVLSSGKQYFLGVKLNDNNQATNVYACGIKNSNLFCIEGTKDGSGYLANKELVQKEHLWNNSCTEGANYMQCGVPNDPNLINAYMHNIGNVDVGLNSGICLVDVSGVFMCY